MSIPMDVAAGKSKIRAFPPHATKAPLFGPAPEQDLNAVAKMIENAKLPVLFLGMRASSPAVVGAVREFLNTHPMAVIETFQAAGAVPKDLVHLFYGRVGLFRNQTGDQLLAKSDLILTLGYDPTEYDASAWNPDSNLNVVNIDYQSCDYGHYYNPQMELLGSVKENMSALTKAVKHVNDPSENEHCQKLRSGFVAWQQRNEIKQESGLIHPLHFITALQARVSKDTTVTCDVGTV